MTPPARYSSTAIFLHWLVAALVIGNFALGWYMHELPLSPAKLRYYSYHKWVGVTVWAVVLIRVAWRLSHPVPPLPPGTPKWQVHAASFSHLALYALTLVIPISGWMMSSAAGFRVVYFGLLPLPDLVPKNEAWFEYLRAVHEYFNWALLTLVLVHVAAALKHHYFDADDVLKRMLPRFR